MTAAARSHWRAALIRYGGVLRQVGPGALAIALALASSANAQLALSASVTSDYRYRGASLGADEPAVTANASQDMPLSGSVGGYFGAAATVGRFPGAGLDVFSNSEYVGVAGPVDDESSWDVGVSHYDVAYDANHIVRKFDAEVYAGLKTRFLTYYVRYSPHYFANGVAALYAETDGSRALIGTWRAFAHFGALSPLSPGGGVYALREEYDGRLGVSTHLKSVGLSLAWMFQRPGGSRNAWIASHKDAIAVTATCFF